MGGDELNILKNGANYGWPIITYGVDYSGEIVSKETHKEGMEQPVVQWTPSPGVSAAEFITGNLFSKWKNDLLVGALAFEEIRRLVIDKNSVQEQEIILKGVGRVRDLKIGPDGALYVLLNNPDMVLRISPEW
jgi:glucose/arabinose dehydrogenase